MNMIVNEHSLMNLKVNERLSNEYKTIFCRILSNEILHLIVTDIHNI
jgi:hypothetical protein